MYIYIYIYKQDSYFLTSYFSISSKVLEGAEETKI